MNMFQAVISVFSKYAEFKGRASRSEFWYFVLFNLIVFGILIAIGGFPGKGHRNILLSIYCLATLCPSMALRWRRLHDIGKSGLWWFVSLIPGIGSWIFLYWAAQPGEIGPNPYGPDPEFPDQKGDIIG